MPFCNERDTGSNVARCESRLTSDWSPFAKNLNEPTKERKQMEATSVSLCALRCGNRHSDSIAKLIVIDQRVVPKGLAFGRLEPYEAKVSRTVLRGLGASNGTRLPELSKNK